MKQGTYNATPPLLQGGVFALMVHKMDSVPKAQCLVCQLCRMINLLNSFANQKKKIFRKRGDGGECAGYGSMKQKEVGKDGLCMRVCASQGSRPCVCKEEETN